MADLKERIFDKYADWMAEIDRKLWIHGRSQGGVAIYYIRATLAVVITGIVWYVGNLVLFDPETGIVPLTDNMTPATHDKFSATDGTITWFWSIWPVIVLIGAAVYVIYSALIREPRTF